MPTRVKARLRPALSLSKGPQKRLGLGAGIGKTAPNRQSQGTDMVNFPDAEGGHDSNFPVHVRNYLSFMTMVKWTVILTAIISALVIYIIAN